MIISRGRRYIFVHIPKTGGTSLALALEGRAMKDDLMLGDTPKAMKRRRKLEGVKSHGRLWKHSTLAQIEGVVTSDEIEDMLCFTVVRNPWDRLVSYYRWMGAQSFDHPVVWAAKRLKFHDFLRVPEVSEPLRDQTAEGYFRSSKGHQHEGLYIRIEHFEDEAEPLFEHLGFRLDLPWENKSKRIRDYRVYYSDDDVDFVADICADDIAKFGYAFE